MQLKAVGLQMQAQAAQDGPSAPGLSQTVVDQLTKIEQQLLTQKAAQSDAESLKAVPDPGQWLQLQTALSTLQVGHVQHACAASFQIDTGYFSVVFYVSCCCRLNFMPWGLSA